MLASRDQVLLRLAVVGADDDLPHPLDEARKLHHAVDLGDGGVLARLAGLEQLGHARKASGDVLRLRRFTGDLGDDVALEHFGAVRHEQVRADRQHVAAARFPERVFRARRLTRRRLHRHAGLELALLVFDDDPLGETGDFIDLLADRHLVHDVAEREGPADLGQNRSGERVPLDEQLARGDAAAFLHLDLGAGDGRVPLLLAAALILDDDLAVPVQHDHVPVAVLDPPDIVVLHEAGVLGLVLGFREHLARRSADVERAHGELRPRLADRLGGDDAHRFAELGQVAGAEIAPVTQDADPTLGLARQR